MFILSKQSNSTPNLLQKGKKEAENLCYLVPKFCLSSILLLQVFYNKSVSPTSSTSNSLFCLPKEKGKTHCSTPIQKLLLFFLHQSDRLLIKLSNSCSLVYHFLVYQLRFRLVIVSTQIMNSRRSYMHTTQKSSMSPTVNQMRRKLTFLYSYRPFQAFLLQQLYTCSAPVTETFPE